MDKNHYITIKKAVYLASQLYDSIDDNNLSAVKSLLLEKGANPNIIIPTKGISSFHLVIGNDNKEFAENVSRLILQSGGNPNVRSEDGLTPVHIAAAWGRIEILQMLLSNGGDPEYRDSNWMTPYRYAVKENYLDCAELLKSYLPVKYDVINKEMEDCCRFKLEKIIVDNGYFTGEYEISDNTIESNSIKEECINENCGLENLAQLPVTDNTKLVMNWFNKHMDYENNETYIKEINNSETESYLSNESSINESDNENDQKRNMLNVMFRKVYKKKKKIIKKKTTEIPIINNRNITNKDREYSSESGIVTLPNSKESHSNINNNKINESGSDYMTASNSNSLFNRNIFTISNDASKSLFTSDDSNIAISDKKSDSTDLSFITVSEIYKYEDKSEGIILFQKRTVKVGSETSGSLKSGSISSKMSSLPENIDCDPNTLRQQLILYGYDPGPITITTKKIYLKKLYQLKKQPMPAIRNDENGSKRVYSLELEKTLKNPTWTSSLEVYRDLETAVIKDFNLPNPTKKWREGNNKSSFTYLLLDPRKTDNLPCKVDTMSSNEIWKTFLSAIFYVGKGKRNRPYSHLYDAVNLWKQNVYSDPTKKIQIILDIWKSGSGVICLHIFQNIIPVEAYTREAAMIAALKLENLSNLKGGEYYGTASTWGGKQKRMFGSYLLHKAMTIFLNEGERQLFPNNID